MLEYQDNGVVSPSVTIAGPGTALSAPDLRPGEVRTIDSSLPGPVPFYFGHDILPALAERLRAEQFDRLFLVTTAPVHALHGEAVLRHLQRSFPCEPVLIPDGEAHKSFAVLNDLCETLIRRDVTKDSVLLAFGGGVTGNVVGLAAALVYRGVRFVEVPTTFQGQTDSCLSNKQAVNSRFGKNHLGVYYAPRFIWVDTRYLLTEPPRMRRAGLVETVKNGLIADRDFFGEVVRFLRDGVPVCPDRIFRAAYRSILSKTAILRRDPGERGYAVVLEYGHTIGHAVERLAQGRLPHGEAVALGMMAAAQLSRRLGGLDGEAVEAHRYVLGDLLGMDLQLPRDLTVDQVLQAITLDNKKTGRGVQYVLLRSLGQVMFEGGSPLRSVPPQLVREVLEAMHGGG